MRLFEGTQFDIPPTCDSCEKLESECECPPPAPEPQIVPPAEQKLKVRVERRKYGKSVTVIAGVADDDAKADLLSRLKNFCGSGGSSQAETLEIQGDHSERVTQFLSEQGYRIK